MTVIKSEFVLALNQVAGERGISPQEVISSIETALVAAYKKEYPEYIEDETITAKLNQENGEAKLLRQDQDITPPGFGRIAAQTAKQVILQKIREAEKRTIISHYKGQIGSIVRGRIIRYDGFNAFLDIGKAEAVLPKEEQIRNEDYSVNNSFIVYLKEIGEDKFGHQRIVVSRSDVRLIEELFKREVPEIGNNTVEIKKTVREPGERAKIAVYSTHGAVDPVGACVGQKGARVQTVTDEFNGKEKIDIIQWNKDDKLFITASLSPAKISHLEIDSENKRAKVTVEESQAPLAIGKGGINVNLAARLTGYTLDIVQVTDTATHQEAESKSEEQKSPSN